MTYNMTSFPQCDFRTISTIADAPRIHLDRCPEPADRVVVAVHSAGTEFQLLVEDQGTFGVVPGIARLCQEHVEHVVVGDGREWHPGPALLMPLCPACGFQPSDMETSADATHDNLCCGARNGCFWEGECATHDTSMESRDGVRPPAPLDMDGTYLDTTPTEESLGPVTNPDGTPSDVTLRMLQGTGRPSVADRALVDMILDND